MYLVPISRNSPPLSGDSFPAFFTFLSLPPNLPQFSSSPPPNAESYLSSMGLNCTVLHLFMRMTNLPNRL